VTNSTVKFIKTINITSSAMILCQNNVLSLTNKSYITKFLHITSSHHMLVLVLL